MVYFHCQVTDQMSSRQKSVPQPDTGHQVSSQDCSASFWLPGLLVVSVCWRTLSSFSYVICQIEILDRVGFSPSFPFSIFALGITASHFQVHLKIKFNLFRRSCSQRPFSFINSFLFKPCSLPTIDELENMYGSSWYSQVWHSVFLCNCLFCLHNICVIHMWYVQEQ